MFFFYATDGVTGVERTKKGVFPFLTDGTLHTPKFVPWQRDFISHWYLKQWYH